jgi:hypothetical protein
MRMCHICGLPRPAPLRSAPQHFSVCLINGTIFGKKLLNTKCVFQVSVQLLSETFFIQRSTEGAMIEKNMSVFM